MKPAVASVLDSTVEKLTDAETKTLTWFDRMSLRFFEAPHLGAGRNGSFSAPIDVDGPVEQWWAWNDQPRTFRYADEGWIW